ncbi:MAG TPA: SAM-dependent methyltransferase [Thermoanaerobaculia bacterium]|nr:SAM-dependent methyltransferase [Thermoanaerobaculia bacterium]
MPFRQFVEAALYDPEFGYYARPRSGLDYATSVDLSPVFPFALGRLAEEVLARSGDGLCAIVDIGCGDGTLLAEMREAVAPELRKRCRFVGIDRAVGRLRPELAADRELRFGTDASAIGEHDVSLVVSNELYDAMPFARLVGREEGLRELWVVEGEGGLEWDEREAPAEYAAYFEERGIELERGQFADVSLDWGREYGKIARSVKGGLLITIDYGFPEEKLFDVRVRRWGTAAAFRRHRLTRDLLADAGAQDLTAHVNLSDLVRAGEEAGWRTVGLTRQARFLMAIGAAEHPLLAPLDAITAPASAEQASDLAALRDAARRLVLPDGIGDEMRVLIQARGIEPDDWSFARAIR